MASAALVAGCNTTGCTDNQNSVPLAGFYSYATFDPISVPGIEIGGVGAPADSLLLKSSGSQQQVYLPLRAAHDVTKFFIHYTQPGLDDPALNDTLTFTYTATPYFASEECGAMYHYRISHLGYTRHLIDSVGMTDSLVTNVEREQIRIFFRTVETSPDEPENPDEPVTPDEPDSPDSPDNPQPDQPDEP